MAIKYPRNRAQARIDILEACKNITFAGMALYKKPVGKKKNDRTGEWEQQYVIGPSIRFAEEAIRAWRNIKVQTMVIYEDEDRRITAMNVVDLESNISFSPKITVEKTVERKSATGRDIVSERLNSYNQRVFIVKATDDEIRNKEQALLSKELRNCILKIIPQDITEDAKEQIHKTVAAGISTNLESETNKILDAFAGIGVKPKDLEVYLKHAIAIISPAEVADLRTVFKTIQDGEATWASYVDGAAPGDDGQSSEPAAKPSDLFQAGDPEKHVGPGDGVGKGKTAKPAAVK